MFCTYYRSNNPPSVLVICPQIFFTKPRPNNFISRYLEGREKGTLQTLTRNTPPVPPPQPSPPE